MIDLIPHSFQLGFLAVITVVVSFVLTRIFSSSKSLFMLLDKPNIRSLHNRLIPRTGGLAIGSSIFIGLLLIYSVQPIPSEVLWIIGGGSVVAFVALLDDIKDVLIANRLLSHVLAMVLLLQGNFGLIEIQLPYFVLTLPSWMMVVFTLLFGTWMVNLYNFMDGMDGFAAGMALIGFSTFAIFGIINGDKDFVFLSLVIASASAGFLLLNFPPAKIFMGDLGSATLGFMMVALILWANKSGIFPLWIGCLVFAPFIIDSTVTLVKRILRCEKIWQAHKKHYYQRLVQAGWGHKRTVIFHYGIMIASSVSALIAINASQILQLVIIVFWGLFYTCLFMAISRLDNRYYLSHKVST